MFLGEISKDLLTRPLTRNEVFAVFLRLSVFGAATYFSIKWVSDALDPTRKQRIQLKKKVLATVIHAMVTSKLDYCNSLYAGLPLSLIRVQNVVARLLSGVPAWAHIQLVLCQLHWLPIVYQAERLMKQIGVEGVKLTEHEMNIAAHLVDPKDIKVSWEDIAGLDEVVSELQDTVILPFQQRHLFHHSRLCQPPQGVLLYGPPGCGKTLLAKATAQASGCRFINLQASTLTDKWYGESQKLTAAVFSLATKIQPCIIFIDEIDAFLRNRSDADHEATAMMKAEFMSLWDGMETGPSCQVMVLGASNRPQDVDPAILRRMPTTFQIGLPTQRQRQDILKLILSGENLSNAVSLKELAEKTNGYSGSDLRELCRDAAMYRVRDYVRKQQMKQIAQMLHDGESEDSDLEEEQLRPLTQLDLLLALEKMKESRGAATATSTLKELALD